MFDSGRWNSAPDKMKQTQHFKILNLLRQNEWTCTNFMYASFIADPRKRLEELRKEGYEMEWRWCQNPTHNHDGHSKEWRLIKSPKPQKSMTSEEILQISLGAK